MKKALKDKLKIFLNLKIEHIIVFLLSIILIIVIFLSVIKGGANLIAKKDILTNDDNYITYSHEYNKDNVYGEEQTPNMENYPSEQFEDIPIACWGDELSIAPNNYTPSYAAFLSRNASRIVFNMALENCNAEAMGGRQGGLPVYVMPCDIPAKKSSVEVVLKNDYTDNLTLNFSKNAGLNPCSINGITGIISEFDGTLKFTRDKSGYEEIILKPTVLTTRAMEYRRNDITIFFLGKDTSYKDMNKLINIYDKMIAYLETDKYLIIGPVIGDVNTLKKANETLAQKYGDKFLNLYDYLLNTAPAEYSLSITSKGNEQMQQGHLPENYLQNASHFNKLGAEITGNIVSNKLKELKYYD